MLTLEYAGNTLISVPSMHYRAVFAEMVNHCCADSATRPTAIAVELPPNCTAEVAAWVRELMDSTGVSHLPCMLGLMQQNRKIHPRYREAALLLQERTGKPLHELSQDILHRELNHAAVEFLCLSPTDSIIEAIRCACELEVPVFGVDMEESPPLLPGKTLTGRDPQLARCGLQQYVDFHARVARSSDDLYCHTRREWVMSARLKNLLQQFERVLFVCGLLHWPRIRRMMSDPAVQPAHEVPSKRDNACKRVLIHPEYAIRQMDIFPAISAAYEVQRQPANRDGGMLTPVEYTALFQSTLDKACARYAEDQATQSGSSSDQEGLHGVQRFSQFLSRNSLMSQQITPSMPAMLQAAQSMLPSALVKILADTFMDYEWVAPKQFPDLAIAGPESRYPGPGGRRSGRSTLIMPRKLNDQEAPYYEKTAPFYMTAKKGQENLGLPPSLWDWRDEPEITTPNINKYGSIYIWPPCDYLYYATSYAAINLAEEGRIEQASEAFSGALFDGIDLKASLRSRIRGEDKLYVQRPIHKRVRTVRGAPKPVTFSHDLELQPTVFLFSPGTEIGPEDWGQLIAGNERLYEDLSPKGKKMFDQIGSSYKVFLESIYVSTRQPVPSHLHPWVTSSHFLHGSLRFGNPCVNYYQASIWLEKCRFKASPILSWGDRIEDLIVFYDEHHNLEVDPGQWESALILFALPYATTTHKVIVVAPEQFRINGKVQREAKRRGVELVTIPLTTFPPQRINQIRCHYSVQASLGGKEYPPELEHLLGQNLHTYRNLLPREIRRQTMPRFATPLAAETSMN